MAEIKLEFYVLHYDINAKNIIMWNVFDNWVLEEECIKCIKKYLRAPSKYKHEEYEKETLYGFEAFKEDIRRNIMWQEWSRVEYEIGVSEPFPKENSKVFKWDAYKQCEPNIEFICHEIIRQYKTQIKGE